MRKTLFMLLVAFFGFLDCNAQSIPSNIPTSGLVAYYPFDSSCADISGNGNNGVNHGASPTSDRFGRANSAYSFNGSSNYINLGTGFTNDNNDKTFSVWFKMNSGTYNWIISGGINTDSRAFGLYYDSSAYTHYFTKKLFFHGNGRYYDDAFSDIELGQWYNCVITYSSDIIKCYLNDSLIDTLSVYLNTGSSNILVGARQDIFAFFNGKIDDVGIWNRESLNPVDNLA